MNPSRRHYQCAPVPDTCPKIDAAKREIDEVLVFLGEIQDGDDVCHGDYERAKDRLYTVGGILLEELRSANEALRDWGARTEAALEEARDDIRALERRLS